MLTRPRNAEDRYIAVERNISENGSSGNANAVLAGAENKEIEKQYAEASKGYETAATLFNAIVPPPSPMPDEVANLIKDAADAQAKAEQALKGNSADNPNYVLGTQAMQRAEESKKKAQWDQAKKDYQDAISAFNAIQVTPPPPPPVPQPDPVTPSQAEKAITDAEKARDDALDRYKDADTKSNNFKNAEAKLAESQKLLPKRRSCGRGQGRSIGARALQESIRAGRSGWPH